jgi:AraC family transcriptional regulator
LSKYLILEKEYSSLCIHHQRIIHQAVEYIDTHLDEPLTVALVADKAHYSAFHFHRLFTKQMGETFLQYVKRKRLERTAARLLRNTEESITQLSTQHGFSSNSSLTRAFKQQYGVSPKQFRQLSSGKYSKISQGDSKNGQEIVSFQSDHCSIEEHLNWITMNATIEVKELPALSLAYITQIGPQGLGASFGRLMQWAGPKALLEGDFKMLTVYHDSFKITPAPQVRMSASLVLEKDVEVDGEVKHKVLPAGKHIVAHHIIRTEAFSQAWSSLFVWMNEQGYTKAAADPFEIYHNDFNTHPENKCIVDLCIPIK